MQEARAQSLGLGDALEEGAAATPTSLPGESHGQGSLAGCSPRGHKGPCMTARPSASTGSQPTSEEHQGFQGKVPPARLQPLYQHASQLGLRAPPQNPLLSRAWLPAPSPHPARHFTPLVELQTHFSLHLPQLRQPPQQEDLRASPASQQSLASLSVF